MKTDKVRIWDPYLKGIGQIMLQDNWLTGLLFLIGILVNSPIMALAALISVVVGTLTAKLLKYDEQEINSGLYGFNATLVGVALTANFDPSAIVWITIIVLSALSTVIMNFALRNKIPVFTFPFIFLVWIALFSLNKFIHPEPALPIGDAYIIDEPFSLMAYGLGFGEVIFQGSLISGIIFFIAVYINSPMSALYGLFGAIVGTMTAILLKDRIEDVKMGMFSFNAVLCAIVFSGPKKLDGLFVVVAVILSGITEDIMLRLDASVLTFPFVFATWITLFIKKTTLKVLEQKTT